MPKHRWLLVAAAAGLLVWTGAVSPSLAAALSPPVAVFAPCGPEVRPGFVCGSVDVPLDRANPGAGTIAIAFQLFRHTGTAAQPSEAIVVSVGGPGISNTAVSALWYARFASLLEQRDLLVIDHRGIGQSGAIDCPALQHFTGDLASAVRSCGAQRGSTADRYGSGDVADDVDAVRAALGIDMVDYVGQSYGAVDVRAYAYRYAAHLRSAVLDSPWATEDTFVRSNARFFAKVQATVCRRSPSCRRVNPDPEGTLAWLARKLRKHPFDGVGYDADGGARALHVDESTIFDILSADHFVDPSFLNQGELTAAADALRHRDRAPLLRLAAESPQTTDAGDPTGLISAGASTAVYCSDGRFVWDKSAPGATRHAQYEASLAALPSDSFAPFSATAWVEVNDRVGLGVTGGFAPDLCIYWPSPSRPNPAFPANQPFPVGAPALVLHGDLDVTSLEDTNALVSLFPAGTPFVEVANAGHVTGLWNDCAAGITLHFIETLQAGDTSCAADMTAPMHQPFGAATGLVQLQGVGRFPRRAKQAIPDLPDPSATDHTKPRDRRVASVAWSAVADAVYRSLRMTGTAGRGLRGGSYAVSKSETATDIDLTGIRFANDVAISGHATLDRTTSTLDATISVNGPGSRDGTLTLHGILWNPGHPTGQIRGSLHGRKVALLVPTN